MNLLSKYDEGVNFWEVYPQYKSDKVYKELFTKDKSKGKIFSSKLMWALCLLFLKESNYYKYTEEERYSVVGDNLLDNEKFDWKPYNSLIEHFKYSQLDELDRMIMTTENYLNLRSKQLDISTLKTTDIKGLDEIVISTEKVLNSLDALRARRDKKVDSGVTKGNLNESASERGEI